MTKALRPVNIVQWQYYHNVELLKPNFSWKGLHKILNDSNDSNKLFLKVYCIKVKAKTKDLGYNRSFHVYFFM